MKAVVIFNDKHERTRFQQDWPTDMPLPRKDDKIFAADKSHTVRKLVFLPAIHGVTIYALDDFYIGGGE